jgi:hypothetical protein
MTQRPFVLDVADPLSSVVVLVRISATFPNADRRYGVRRFDERGTALLSLERGNPP